MPPSPTIRHLTPDDLPVFRALMALLGRAFEDEAYSAAPPPDDYVRSLLGRDTFIALAALEPVTPDSPDNHTPEGVQEQKVIGGLTAYVLPKFEQARSEVYIYDLAVDESHRRRGVATALINHLKPIAKARGAWVMFIQADDGDEPPIALYTKLGTRENAVHFDIPVE